MKITAVKTFVCNAVMRNWVFVRIETDQPGLYGWGEATLEWHTRGVVGAIEDLAELIVGEDPLRTEHLWQMMFRQHFWHGSGITRSTAISGIDLALWDIAGKHYGVPCHRLMGGPVRDHIRLYCHLGGGKMADFYETPVENADRFADLARAGRGQWLLQRPSSLHWPWLGPRRAARTHAARCRCLPPRAWTDAYSGAAQSLPWATGARTTKLHSWVNCHARRIPPGIERGPGAFAASGLRIPFGLIFSPRGPPLLTHRGNSLSISGVDCRR